MRASEVAEKVGMDVGPVGTYIGHLSRTGRLRAVTEDGKTGPKGWIAVL
jgi:hypothetical protein